MARNQTITKLQASFDVSSFAVAAMKYPSHRPYVARDTNLLWCKNLAPQRGTTFTPDCSATPHNPFSSNH
jgi:hypothetical protein